jgi:uncharacterized protein (TIGR04255 family)
MSKQYIKPPVIEAVCEFRFSPDTKWDLTTPGLVYEKLQDQFPHKEQHVISEIEINQEAKGIKQQVRTSERIWFLTENRNLFLQVGAHFLAINCLAPYPTWNTFKPEIERALETIGSVVDIQGLERIGLRYVNKIEIAGLTVDLEEYFDFWPHLGRGLPQTMQSFVTGCVFIYSDGRDACKLQFTSAVPESSPANAFLLDLDYFTAQPRTVLPQDALSWVNNAHQNAETVFEGCITDKLRAIFEMTS